MKRFSGKHVVVTGAARGIGFEIASQFAQEGALVSIIDINENSLSEAKNSLSKAERSIYTYAVDLTHRNLVEKTINTIESIAPIDILINNAGIAKETSFLEIEEKEWKNILDVNLTGFFHISQFVCRKMALRKNGVVVNMASKNGFDGEAGYSHYNASKGGIIMLTKTMAIELAQFNIRVNAVCPGYIQTPMSMEIDSPEFTKKFIDRYIPLNRAGNVREIASVFLFLASNESSFMTGQSIVADGGQLAGQKMM
ncbi:MAG: SDR family oxidoreductase [Cytophagales bacterium]|nr:MAG: SDR family oxidoreductase [Cytophagales bacterium]